MFSEIDNLPTVTGVRLDLDEPREQDLAVCAAANTAPVYSVELIKATTVMRMMVNLEEQSGAHTPQIAIGIPFPRIGICYDEEVDDVADQTEWAELPADHLHRLRQIAERRQTRRQQPY